MLAAAAVFFLCLILGVPIAFCLGVSSLVFLSFMKGIPLGIVAQRMFTGVDVFPFMAIPFFILAGDLMNAAKITDKLVGFADLIVGRLKGGLAHVNIVTNMFFAGVSGSAVADASAIGSFLIPMMKEKGFDSDFSAAVTASAAVMGPIIPPSIPMVIYGLITGTSIGALFLSGFIPGVLVGFALMGVAYVIAGKRGYPTRVRRLTLHEISRTTLFALVPLFMPVIILGGILGGIFTATEASAVAVAYALLIGFFAYRTLTLKALPPIFISAAKTTGVVFLAIACSNIFNWLLVVEGMPQTMAAYASKYVHSTAALLLAINILLLILGCLMDATAIMLITVPTLIAITNQFGISPIHFGCIVVLNLMIGLITPPFGLCLFIGCGIAGISLETIVEAIWPFIIVEVIVLFLVTYVEPVSMFIPRLFGYG
jgi:tripartite ATP-independent transporter DctM subunit